MAAGILVAYATKHGSTGQVAEAIAGHLRERGSPVHLVPAGAAREPVHGYALVVLGTPLYNGRWHRDARRFLKRHRADLARVPVAVFAMGPRTDDPQSWQRSAAQLDRCLARFPWLAPVSIGVFGGVDPPDPRGRRPHRDLRDWTSIRAWALNLSAGASAPSTATDGT